MKLSSIILAIKRSHTLKSGIWYLLSDFAYKGMAFLTIPVFTRLLTVDEYGIVSVYTSLVGITVVATGLEMNVAVGRAPLDFKHEYSAFLSSVLIFSMLPFFLTFIAVYLLSESIGTLVSMDSKLLMLAVITGYATFVFKFYTHHLLFRQEYIMKSLLQIFKAILEVVLAIVLVTIIRGSKHYGRIYSTLVVSVLFMVISFIVILLNSNRICFPKAWFYSLKIGVPLIPHALSAVLLSQFDRIAIQTLVSSEQAGLYSFAYNIGMIPLVVLGATNSAWMPWFYRQLSSERTERIRRAASIYSVAFLTITIAIMMVGPELAIIMAPNAYSSASRIIPVISLSYLLQFLYSLYVNFAIYRKKTIAISIGTLMAGIVNIILNILTIPKFGYEVAAWTTVISYFLLFIFHWLNVRFILGYKTIPVRNMLVIAAIGTLIAFQQYFVSLIFLPYSLQERFLRILVSSFAMMFIIVYGLKQAN